MSNRLMSGVALFALLAGSAYAGEATLGSALRIADNTVKVDANASVKNSGKKSEESAPAPSASEAQSKGAEAGASVEAAGKAGMDSAKEGGKKVQAGAKTTVKGAHKVVKSTVGGVTGAVGGLTGDTSVNVDASAKAEKKADDKPSDQ